MTTRKGPLDGIKVLDFTRVLAGPFCTQMLGDLGAEVIKVERPGRGDDTRHFAPPFLADPEGNPTDQSAYFLAANRNKKSITLDLTSEDGQEIARQLISQSDVVVENFKTGNLAKYGLSYEDVKEANPELVYCSITGFGQTGPYANRPGYDFLIQGMGGIMSITGEPEGQPQKVGTPVADLVSGMFAAIAINAAIYNAKATGQGQYIDIGMLDAVVALLTIAGMNYLHGDDLGRLGNDHPNIVPYRPFKTADDYIIVAVGNDSQFERFCQVLGCREVVKDERFATNQMRVRNRKALSEVLEPVMAKRPSQEWLEELEQQKIGCGPINNLQQVFEDPHVLARNMLHDMPHAVGEGVMARLLASPFKYSETPVTYRHAPPVLGEHTTEILSDRLGMDADAIERLRDNKVVD